MDFAKLVNSTDLAGEDFLSKPIKKLKDAEKIKNFFESKKNYYKNMGKAKGGAWKTDDGDKKKNTPAQLGMIQATRV